VMLLIPGLAAGYVIRLALTGQDVSQALRLPSWLESRVQRDAIAYPTHVALARGFALFHASPVAEGLQWMKAAAHARSDDQIRTIGEGLRLTLQRTEPAQFAQVSDVLCQAAFRGSQTSHSMVVALSGLDCSIELRVAGHIPAGQPIYYRNNPPVAGPHYDSTYPTYGVIEEPVAPGFWVHNLEHGAVVVLYRCDEACPGLVDDLRSLYRTLEANRNSVTGQPRLLVVPYPELSAQLAMIAWGESVLLDHFDAEVITDFYNQRVDRGPECRALRCPQ
jgi:hypothetical protein